MDAYIHTMIATGCIAGAYYIGKHVSGKNMIEDIVTSLLEALEKDGFIATVSDQDGEKELIPVSELIAKALRESKKLTKKVKRV